MNVVKRSIKRHPYITLAASIILAPVLYYFLAVFPQRQADKYLETISSDDLNKPETRKFAFDIENSNRLTVAQIVGGFALLAGLYFAYQNTKVAQDNVRITEEGKITERFSKAVEMLGSKNLDVRLGGIYALERIARDSEKDHWTVMEVLTAFVREHAPYTPDLEEKLPEEKTPKPREDIQAIMTVIGRRKWTEEDPETDTETEKGKRLDLQKVNLARCILAGANLSKANLNDTNLNYAILNNTDLSNADLSNADLRTAKSIILDQILLSRPPFKALLPPSLEEELKEWQKQDVQARLEKMGAMGKDFYGEQAAFDKQTAFDKGLKEQRAQRDSSENQSK